MNNSDFIDAAALREIALRHGARVGVMHKWREVGSSGGALPTPLYYLSVPADTDKAESPITPAFTTVSDLIGFCHDQRLYERLDGAISQAAYATQGTHPRP